MKILFENLPVIPGKFLQYEPQQSSRLPASHAAWQAL
jgi:hypothetical protein